MAIEKVCPRCNTLKPLDSFGKNKRAPDGINYICKSCHSNQVKSTQRKRTLRTSSQLSEDQKRLRPDGVKRCRMCNLSLPLTSFGRSIYCADGLNDNCQKCNISRVSAGIDERRRRSSSQIEEEQRVKHPEGIKLCPECLEDKPISAFYSESLQPDGLSRLCIECKLHAYRVRYVSRRSLVIDTLMERYGTSCLHPDCVETSNLQIDHVIPLVMGGPNSIGNYQLLCSYHNSSKGGSHVDYRFDKGKSLMV